MAHLLHGVLGHDLTVLARCRGSMIWSKRKKITSRQSDNFDYIDGAGEVYRAYNMRTCLSRRYAAPEGPRFILDLFEMALPMMRSESSPMTGWRRARHRTGRRLPFRWLGFWKDRFFVSLYADEDTEAAKQALLELAGEVASLIKKQGRAPDPLPIAEKRASSEECTVFSRHPDCSTGTTLISAANILRLEVRTEAVLSAYQFKDGSGTDPSGQVPGRGKGQELFQFSEALICPMPIRQGLPSWKTISVRGLVKGPWVAVVLEADSREIGKRSPWRN